jgi:hypothetical protein
MKPAVSIFAALLLATLACSKSRAQEPTPPPAAHATALPQVARAPDTAPAAADADPAPSPEEVAAFHAPVPK